MTEVTVAEVKFSGRFTNVRHYTRMFCRLRRVRNQMEPNPDGSSRCSTDRDFEHLRSLGLR